jgi:hypothetical protein
MFPILPILSLAFLVAGFFLYRRSRAAFRWFLIFGGLAACLFTGVLALLALGLAYSHPESGVGVASVGWLDSRASDISYYRANDFSGNFVYEFRISRADFEALARERGWQVTALPGRRNIMRYTFFLPETDVRHQRPFDADVNGGLFFERRQANGGGTTVLYDTNALRAYVSESSR